MFNSQDISMELSIKGLKVSGFETYYLINLMTKREILTLNTVLGLTLCIVNKDYSVCVTRLIVLTLHVFFC